MIQREHHTDNVPVSLKVMPRCNASKLEGEMMTRESEIFKVDFVHGVFTGKDNVHEIKLGIASKV